MAKLTICSVNECGKNVSSRGLCSSHYPKHLREGIIAKIAAETKMQWIERHLSWTDDACLVWPWRRGSGGYARISVKGKAGSASKIMCELTHGKSMTPADASHSCGNGHLGCLNPKHIRWLTHKDNCSERPIHGTDNRGGKHPRAVLTNEDIRTIRALKGSLMVKDIASSYGVASTTISAVLNGKSWQWLE